MIEETGTVVGEQQDRVWVRVVSDGGCPRCREGGGCGQQSMARLLGDRVRQVLVDNAIGARVGDRVLLGVEPHALLWASLITYLLPLAGLIGGALLGELIGGGGDAFTIAGAVLGVVLAVAAGRYLTRRSPVRALLQPQLLKRLPEPQCANKPYLT